MAGRAGFRGILLKTFKMLVGLYLEKYFIIINLEKSLQSVVSQTKLVWSFVSFDKNDICS